MFLFNEKHIASNKIAKAQRDHIIALRNNFAKQQENNRKHLISIGASNEDIQANAGIGMLDFWQDVDKRLVSIRQNSKFAIVKDIESLATSVSIGALSSVNLMSKDISDDVTRSMDLQGKNTFDNLGSDYDKNPIPGFTAGVGMNYRTYMGQQDAQLGLYAEAIERKSIKMAENIGDYMYNGDTKITADGQAGEGIKNHRNTGKLDLGATGYNINLATATPDALRAFFVNDLGKVIDDNALGMIDVMWVSPEIYRNLQQPVGDATQFKEERTLDWLVRLSEIGAIEKDYSLSGNEFIMYKRDQQVISPLIALPMTGYQVFRPDPYGNYNQKMIAVQGLRVAKTYDNLYGVFYGSEIS